MKKVLLFDVGDVLAPAKGFDALATLLEGRLTREELKSAWSQSPLIKEIHIKPIDALRFAQRCVAEWQIPMAPNAFLEFFASWPQPLSAEIIDLLTRLRESYLCAALSNTNSIHQKSMIETGLLKHLDRCFFSPDIGYCKPNPLAYQYVLSQLDTLAENTVFFDDMPANVDGARAVGMQAHRVESVEGLPALIHNLGYL